MINLIDASTKRDLKAARLNIVLLTYCVIIMTALVAVVLLALFSHWWLANQINVAHADQAAYEAKTDAYAPTKAAAAAFSGNLAKIQSVLSNHSSYSTALLNIASTLPQGASVSSLSFSATFVATPLSISAVVPTNEAAVALRDKLAKSPIYSNVTLNNVNCGDSAGSCNVTITATMAQAVFTPGATE